MTFDNVMVNQYFKYLTIRYDTIYLRSLKFDAFDEGDLIWFMLLLGARKAELLEHMSTTVWKIAISHNDAVISHKLQKIAKTRVLSSSVTNLEDYF